LERRFSCIAFGGEGVDRNWGRGLNGREVIKYMKYKNIHLLIHLLDCYWEISTLSSVLALYGIRAGTGSG